MKCSNSKGQVAQVVGAGREDFFIKGQGGALFAYEQRQFRIEIPTVNGFRLLAANAGHVDLRHRAVSFGQYFFGLKDLRSRSSCFVAISELNFGFT